MGNEELLPCPFCQSPGELVHQRWSAGHYYSVKCSECGAWLDSRSGTPEDAAKSWNERYSDAELTALVEQAAVSLADMMQVSRMAATPKQRERKDRAIALLRALTKATDTETDRG